MKKVLLGVLALTSVASFAEYNDFHGYLKSETEANVNITGTTGKFKTKLDLGSYVHANKEIFVFAGTDALLHEYKTEGDEQTLTPSDATNYYFGARWDSAIVDDFNIALTFGQKNKFTEEKNYVEENGDRAVAKKVVEKTPVLEDAIVAHLKAKGTFDQAKFDSDKGAYLKDRGYAIEKAEKTSLLSAVLTGQIDKNYNVTVAGLYNSNDFKDGSHELESYVKVDGDLNSDINVGAGVNHHINSAKYDHWGTLKGNAFITTKLNPTLTLSNKVEAKLENLKPLEKTDEYVSAYKGEAKTENQLKYVNNGLEITGDANYKSEFDSKPTPLADTAVNGFKRNSGTVKHIPEVKLGVKHTRIAGLTLEGSIADKYEHKIAIGTPEADTTKTVFESANTLNTNASVTYTNDGLTLKGLAHHVLKTDFLVEQGKQHSHLLLSGLGLGYTKTTGNTTVTTSLDGRHLLRANSEADINEKNVKLENGKLVIEYGAPKFKYSHEGYVWSNNSVKSVVDNTTIEAKLNGYGRYSQELDLAVLAADAGFKVTSKFDKLTTLVDLDGKYGHVLLNATEGDVADDVNGASAGLLLEAKYQTLANVEVGTGLKTEYVYNKLGNKLYEFEAKYTTNASKKDDVYRTYNEFLAKEDVKFQHDVLDQQDKLLLNSKSHELNFKPAIFANLTYSEGRLTVSPRLEGTVKLNNTADAAKLGFVGLEGKGTLKINYTW